MRDGRRIKRQCRHLGIAMVSQPPRRRGRVKAARQAPRRGRLEASAPAWPPPVRDKAARDASVRRGHSSRRKRSAAQGLLPGPSFRKKRPLVPREHSDGAQKRGGTWPVRARKAGANSAPAASPALGKRHGLHKSLIERPRKGNGQSALAGQGKGEFAVAPTAGTVSSWSRRTQ